MFNFSIKILVTLSGHHKEQVIIKNNPDNSNIILTQYVHINLKEGVQEGFSLIFKVRTIE